MSPTYHLQLSTIETYILLEAIKEQKSLGKRIKVASIIIMFGNNLCLCLYRGKFINAAFDVLALNNMTNTNNLNAL